MRTYDVKSKVYVVPTKTSLIAYIFVNLLILAVLVWTIIDIIGNGILLRNILLIFLSLASQVAMRVSNLYRPHHEKSPATLQVDASKLVLDFKKHSRNVKFDISRIKSLEYSDQINCLRIVGDYIFTSGKKTMNMVDKEYLFFASVAELGLFKEELESVTGKKIIFVDREK